MRVLSAMVALATAAAVAGCTSGSTGNSAVTVSGKTLTIYLSEAQARQPGAGLDVLDAERLAWNQSPHSVGAYTLRLVPVHSPTISADARIAIQDQSAIAYLGEVVPHASFASLGITNAVQLLQISPTDTALELTQVTPAVPGAPDAYYQALSTYGRTFARVVPNTAREAQAEVQEMHALGVRKLYVAQDGGPYGAALAYAVKHFAAGKISVTDSQSGADGLLYAGSSAAGATRFFAAAAASNPTAKLFGPSALYDPSFTAGLSASVRNLYLDAPGFRPQDLPPAGTTFVSQFQSAWGHVPVPQAIFGYEAMSALIAVLREAGAAASNRSTVVKDFLSLRNRASAVGTYSMNSGGDTSIAPFVFARVQGGKLVPVAQVQG